MISATSTASRVLVPTYAASFGHRVFRARAIRPLIQKHFVRLAQLPSPLITPMINARALVVVKLRKDGHEDSLLQELVVLGTCIFAIVVFISVGSNDFRLETTRNFSDMRSDIRSDISALMFKLDSRPLERWSSFQTVTERVIQENDIRSDLRGLRSDISDFKSEIKSDIRALISKLDKSLDRESCLQTVMGRIIDKVDNIERNRR